MADSINQSNVGFDAVIDKKKSIIYGVILGIISFILGLVVLFVVKDLNSFWGVMSMSFIVNTGLFVIISALFAFSLRKANGGYWNFSIALKSIFMMLAISTIISTIGTQAYVNFINPTLQEKVETHTINVTIEYMEKNNVPDEVIDSKIAELEKQVDAIGKITLGQVLKGLAITLMFQFVFALLLSALTKREKLVIKQETN
ncbi:MULTISPECIES: DUF4199 domain-containing protein [Sphingobacterium]|jgi:hypothetical protein|uniref:DUF4199 domain-containing protein n=1 Tax=Sphingobacterium multivorum TaxID=28454 RepID=A0A654DRG4_SPHMU|nr:MULTISPECIES: DUF4199 domain-containing protein [Sphingobacterium]HAE68464.1 DUF4199 domain-containing protein [Sphingobacterium sp.]OFV11551.1 hypothetical protein HMPREF3127_18560 [Sphingobacterium sp. HMSC13C05]QQT46543.1 DUF4199 domain-containing protein [Sphingobacterium multivorum]QQT60850.1 DUF4199 domain-containing protein [Sphingobacterium multivorum]SUJ89857.1 Uncharacterised protein [Sphingobacterium multivorum]